MRKAVLERFESDQYGTFGNFTTDSGFHVYSMELNWDDNRENTSCIPVGEYNCVMHESPKFGRVYIVENVPNRSQILIHPANWAGDTKLNLRCQLNGCIALGRAIGDVIGQKGLLSSRDAVEGLKNDMEERYFKLEIINAKK